MKQWNIGMLEYWNAGMLECWNVKYFGIFIPYKALKKGINKLKYHIRI
jgi:hypothetical protein